MTDAIHVNFVTTENIVSLQFIVEMFTLFYVWNMLTFTCIHLHKYQPAYFIFANLKFTKFWLITTLSVFPINFLPDLFLWIKPILKRLQDILLRLLINTLDTFERLFICEWKPFLEIFLLAKTMNLISFVK